MQSETPAIDEKRSKSVVLAVFADFRRFRRRKIVFFHVIALRKKSACACGCLVGNFLHSLSDHRRWARKGQQNATVSSNFLISNFRLELSSRKRSRKSSIENFSYLVCDAISSQHVIFGQQQNTKKASGIAFYEIVKSDQHCRRGFSPLAPLSVSAGVASFFSAREEMWGRGTRRSRERERGETAEEEVGKAENIRQRKGSFHH